MISCNFGNKYMKFHALSESGYNQAIQYYNQQKKNFISWLNKQGPQDKKQLTNNFIQSINNEIIYQFENQQQGSSQSELFNKIADKIKNYLITSPNSSSIAKDVQTALKTIRLRGRGIAQVEGKEMAEKIKDTLQKIIEQGEIQELMDQAFKEVLGKSLSSLTQGQLQNAYGYTRRIIYNYFKPTRGGYQEASINGKALNGYINSFSGLFKEEIIEIAINQLFKENGLQGISAQRIGETTVDGKESRTDVIIGLNNQKLDQTAIKIAQLDDFMAKVEKVSLLQDTSLEVNLFDPNNFIGAGVQSKSWPSPDFVYNNNLNPSKKQLRPFFSIGNRAEFYSDAAVKSGEQFGVYSWHYNIYALSRKIIPILGSANILYSTRDGMFWTADLIRQFTKQNYYLSYYFTRSKGTFNRPATKEITWQQEVSSDSFKGFNDV